MSRAAAVLLLGLLAACGKRGDPSPPLRVVPQPVTELRLAQRGDRLETSLVAPRLSSDGGRLGVLEIELHRATKEGDFERVAEREVRRVAPGESLLESQPLPPPGTSVRVAARAVARGRASGRAGPVTLVAQAPPLAPQALTAELVPSGVLLRWVDPNPAPSPSASPAPAGTPAAGATPAPAAPTPPPTAAPTPAPTAAPQGRSPNPPGVAVPAASPTPQPTPTPLARGYWIYRRARDGAYQRPLRSELLASPRYEDGAVEPGQEWCYVVRFAAATDPIVESASSGEVCLAIRDVAAPAPPIGVAVVLLPDAIEISWSPSGESDLAGYRVYRAAPPGEPPVRLAELGPEQRLHRDRGALAGTLNVYTVTALDKAGNESAPSSPVQVRP